MSFNWNLFITIMTYIVLVWAIAAGFGKGWRRGWQRSTLRLGILIGCLIIAGFVAWPISNALMGIDGTFLNVVRDGEVCKTIGEAIEGAILNIEGVESAANSSSTLMALIKGLPIAIINVVVFTILVWVFRLISFIIYKIIDRTALKSSKLERQLKKQQKLDKKNLKKGETVTLKNEVYLNQKPKRRVIGGVIGAVQGFLLLFLSLMPFSAIASTFDEIKASANAETEFVVSADSYYTETVEVNNNLNEKAYDILKNTMGDGVVSYFESYNSSVASKILTLGGLDNVIFDGLTKVESPSGNIKVRKDIVSFVYVFDDVMDILNLSSDSVGLSGIDFEKVKSAMGKLLDTQFVSQLAPELLPYLADSVIESATFKELPASETLKAEILDLLEEYKQNGINESLKADLNASIDIFSTVVKSGLFDEIYGGEVKAEEILNCLQKDDSKLLNEIIDGIYSSKLLSVAGVEAFNFANSEIDKALNLETKLVDYTSKTLFIESEKQSVKNVLTAFLKSFDILSKASSIETLTDEQISTVASLLTELQNNTFKKYENSVLVGRKDVLVNKTTLTATNAGPFANLYLTIVNYVAKDYITNINYEKADWENVLIAIKNVINAGGEKPSLSDIMTIISLDEGVGESANNIASALDEIMNSTEPVSKEKLSELLTTVSDNIDTMDKDSVNNLIDKVAEQVEMPDLKDKINYDIIIEEKEVAVELAKLYGENSETISEETLNTLANSEYILQEVVKEGYVAETTDPEIENKINNLSASDEVKNNLKALFNIEG